MKGHHSDRLEEMLRIAFVALSGAIFMLVQYWVFKSLAQNIVDNTDVSHDTVNTAYILSVYSGTMLIVFFTSALTIVFWYLIALKLRLVWEPKHLKSATSIWFGCSLLPIIGIVISLYIFSTHIYSSNSSSNSLLPFAAIFIILDVIWLFWQGTAISTPSTVSSAVPLSHLWRGLWRVN